MCIYIYVYTHTHTIHAPQMPRRPRAERAAQQVERELQRGITIYIYNYIHIYTKR